MKVLGLDGKGGYLCSMTAFELSKVIDYSKKVPEPQTDYKGYNSFVGVELDISPAWKRLSDLACNRAQLERAIGQLRACANILEPLAPLVSCDPPEESKGEGQ